MTYLTRGLFALTTCILFAGPCWGQRLIPIRPPVRLPVFRPVPFVPRIPVTPTPQVPHAPWSPNSPPASESASPAHSGSGAQEAHGDSELGAGLAIVFGVFGVLGAIAGLMIIPCAWVNRTVAHLRIVRTPPGEAPETIRQAWIGVEVPLRSWETRPQCHTTLGVLSVHNSECESAYGYSVDARSALGALAKHSATAAQWWRKNVPQLLQYGYQLWFPPEVCEVLPKPGKGEERR